MPTDEIAILRGTPDAAELAAVVVALTLLRAAPAAAPVPRSCWAPRRWQHTGAGSGWRPAGPSTQDARWPVRSARR